MGALAMVWVFYQRVFLTENIYFLTINLRNEKRDKQNKRNRSLADNTTYGDLFWNFTLPFVPVFNTVVTVWVIYEQSVRWFSVLNNPVIKPYKGE